MRELRRFSDIISGLSWLFVAAFIVLYPILLQLTWQQMVVTYLIDMVELSIAQFWNQRSLWRERPYAKTYFNGLDEEAFGRLSADERVRWVEELIRFPSFWARRCFFITIVKSIPVVCWFLWIKANTPGAVVPLEFMKVMSILLLSNVYFTGATFIESHGLASKYLKRLHFRFGLKEVFDRASIPAPKRDLEFFENTAVACIWLFMLVLQLLVLRTTNKEAFLPMEFLLPLIGVVALAQSTRIWNLGRRYLVDGLYDIFESLGSFEPRASNSPKDSLALHSSPLLAHFERIFNSLTGRLRSYERELSHWIFRKTEESRYSALGEISGMVIHDLSAPLHVVHFCTQQLREAPEKVFDPRYLEQLSTSGERALELINALKSYLRAPAPNSEVRSIFIEANSYVSKMLSTQFHARGIGRVRITVDPALDNLQLRVSRPDLIHILLNIQANSLENMLSNHPDDAELILSLGAVSHEEIEILVEDSGTGLTPERFEALTSFAYQYAESEGKRQSGSLGLRLVRRLIERYGGSLMVSERPGGKRGTVFKMKFKRAKEDATALSFSTEVRTNGD